MVSVSKESNVWANVMEYSWLESENQRIVEELQLVWTSKTILFHPPPSVRRVVTHLVPTAEGTLMGRTLLCQWIYTSSRNKCIPRLDKDRHRLTAELSPIQLKIGAMLYHPQHHPQSHNWVLIHLVLHSSPSPPAGTAPTVVFLSLSPCISPEWPRKPQPSSQPPPHLQIME